MSRVLIANPGSDLYGSDRMMLEALTGLIESGAQVIVTMPSEGPLREQVETRGGSVLIADAPVLRKSYLNPRGLVTLGAKAAEAMVANDALLRRLDPDVVYVSTVTAPMWIPSARMRKIPVVSHVHEAEPSAPLVVQRALALPLFGADRVIVNSAFSLDVLLSAFPALRSKATVVYNGVQGPHTIVKPRARLDTPVRLVYVGRLSERKGVDVAVEALALLLAKSVDAVLTLVGAVFPGYESYEAHLRRRVHELGLEGKVVFAGFVPEPWSYLADSDIALVPSRLEEPFGNTAVEGVLAARPVIASAIGGLVEAVAGFPSAQMVAPGDARALAEAVDAVVADWSSFRVAAIADSRAAAERYDPLAFRAEVAGIVHSVAQPARNLT